MNEVELGRGGPEAGRVAVLVARRLCTDAALYGGHPCLSCQAVARQLVSRAADGELQAALRSGTWPRMIEAPPHGTSQKTARSQWARVLSSIGNPPSLTAVLDPGDGAEG